MHEVSLSLAGNDWYGWKEIKIQSGITQVSSEFSLSVTDKWDDNMTPRPLSEGDACSVRIDDLTVMTGYIDEVTASYDDASHTLQVAGRDKTGDLVDSSAPSFQWAGRSLLDGAKVLCQPFGITVTANTDISRAFQSLKSDEGETVFEVLETAARIRGVLLMADGQGGLIIGRPGQQRLPEGLILGQNIAASSSRRSMRDRYSRYTVKGQASNPFGTDSTSMSAFADDKLVSRYRPKTILAEDAVDIAACRTRANWHCNLAFARANAITYTVRTWYLGGQLIRPGMLVPVQDRFNKIDADRLISDVAYIIDDKGLRAELTLMSPDAFDMRELPEPANDEVVW